MKPGPKPHTAEYFRKRYEQVIKARKDGLTYKVIARTFRPPVSPQRVHTICKRAGLVGT
jgi:hypothetical protein